MNRAVLHLVVALAALTATGHRAHADDNIMNFLVGPVLGVRLSGDSGERAVVGIEGGIGWGPERINLGVEHRADLWLYYAELDPWLLVGGSFGVGVDSAGDSHGIVGGWEGIPLGGEFLHGHAGCPRHLSAITVATGLRYTGVLELYVTVKAGVSEQVIEPVFCE
jgi:hypothetical protein